MKTKGADQVTLLLLTLAIVALVVAGRAVRRRFQQDDRPPAHLTMAGAHNLYEQLRRSSVDGPKEE